MKYTKIMRIYSSALVLLLTTQASLAVGSNPSACFATSLGSFCVELFKDTAGITVANFEKYVSDGDYTGSIIHRSVPGFIIQGGGYIIDQELNVTAVAKDSAIENEFAISNTRGTLAMAKLSGDPDSATSEWFINLADNSENLDAQNGGFTVFGQVIGDGMQVVDAIAALPLVDFGGALDETPTIDLDPNNVSLDNFVVVNKVDLAEAAIAVFEDNLLTFPVQVEGATTVYTVSLKLLSVTPRIIFELITESVAVMNEPVANFAFFSARDATLSILSVDIEGSSRVNNVVFELTDASRFQFTLTSIGP